jgi:hypothetical protein
VVRPGGTAIATRKKATHPATRGAVERLESSATHLDNLRKFADKLDEVGLPPTITVARRRRRLGMPIVTVASRLAARSCSSPAVYARRCVQAALRRRSD